MFRVVAKWVRGSVVVNGCVVVVMRWFWVGWPGVRWYGEVDGFRVRVTRVWLKVAGVRRLKSRFRVF